MAKFIDISSWQDATTPDIDFTAVKADGIAGVMVKYTQGVDYINPKARSNTAKARDAGLLVGAYHVGIVDKDQVELEAEHFLRATAGEVLDLAVALDLETFGSSSYPAPQAWAEKFLALVKGRAPFDLIYLNEYLYDQSIGAPWGYGLWAAQFTPKDGKVPFAIQQAPIHVQGIEGAVDVSILQSPRILNAHDPASKVLKAAAIRLPVLHEGDTGAAVSVLQTALRAHGHHIAVDGIYGPITFSVVRDFQAFAQLPVDGITGPLTWAALSPSHAAAAVAVEPSGATAAAGTATSDLSDGGAAAADEAAEQRAGSQGPEDEALTPQS